MKRKSRTKTDNDDDSSRGGRSGCVVHTVVTCVILAIILYVVVLLAVRTEGVRYSVEERLSAAWGESTQVGSVWAKPDLTLVLEHVQTPDFDPHQGAGWRLDELRLHWSWRNALLPERRMLRRVEVEKGVWSFVRADADSWTPSHFVGDAAQVLEWLGIEARLAGTAPLVMLDSAIDIDLSSVDLYWWEAGNLEAFALGVSLVSQQGRMLDRHIHFQELRAARIGLDRWEREDVAVSYLWIDNAPVPLP